MYSPRVVAVNPSRFLSVLVFNLALCVILLIGSATTGFAQIAPAKESLSDLYPGKAYSPDVQRTFPDRVFWGDTHLHTGLSMDAGLFGARLGLEEAYRFARGEEVTSTGGLRAKLSRPLDFLVISDHAELYGLMPQLLKGDPGLLATEQGKRWYDELRSGDKDRIFATAMEIVGSLQQPEPPFESPGTGMCVTVSVPPMSSTMASSSSALLADVSGPSVTTARRVGESRTGRACRSSSIAPTVTWTTSLVTPRPETKAIVSSTLIVFACSSPSP